MNALLRGFIGLLAGASLFQAWAAAFPFDFTYFGSFQHAMHSGDTRGRVRLADLPKLPGTWGLGVTAGLQGEIIQLDGDLLVSHGTSPEGAVSPPSLNEQAALFMSARVQEWGEVPLPGDMPASEFEAYVVRSAERMGLALDQPFVFTVEGRFPALRWHVVTGQAGPGSGGEPTATGHAAHARHANQRSRMRTFDQPGSAGQLVGVYSGLQLTGVVSHPGERFHVHFIDAGRSVSGHVDAYAVGVGAVLKLPLR